MATTDKDKKTYSWSTPNFFEELATFNEQKKQEQAKKVAALKKKVSEEGDRELAKTTRNYTTTSNATTSVARGRLQNKHLEERGLRGAALHAAWEKDHPNLSAWSLTAAAIPFAVAAYPFIAGGATAATAAADATAATATGQAITSGLNFAANAVKANPYVAKALPWINAGLTSLFAGHGASEVSQGRFTPMTALELAPLGQLAKPLYRSAYNVVNSAYSKLPWTYKIPENPNMAYRRMGPLERDWLMEGNELSTRSTNPLTEVERDAAVAAEKAANPNRRFSLFKAGAEHGGRKQFAKGQPWGGTTVTHGEEQVLAIPGERLPWVSGRHFHGPQGNGFGVGDISFEEAPFGSHIDLLTEEGYSGVNPSLLEGSVIYSPYKIFGHKFGYKKLYPTNISTPRGLVSTESLIANGRAPVQSVEEINISPEELYRFLTSLDGYYFLGHGTGRTGVSPRVIFDNGLRIKHGEVSNTTSPISASNLVQWPHLNSEEVIILPGKISSAKYDAAYGHIPTDWFSSSTFLWNDNPRIIGTGFNRRMEPLASFVEQIKNGLPGVFTKPEAVLGSYNTRTHVLRLNPNSQYKFAFPKVESKVVKSVSPDGKIRLSLPSHTLDRPRLLVLEPLGNNKYYVHTRTWDGDHIPANMSASEKQALYDALYEELPEGAEILFPLSSSEYLATRGTVAGLLRLARDSRFTPGTRGTLLYLDKDGKTVRTYEGTSFIKAPRTTLNDTRQGWINGQYRNEPVTLEQILNFIDNDLIPRLLRLGHNISSYKPVFRLYSPETDTFDLLLRESGIGGEAWFSPITDDVTILGPLEGQDFGLTIHEAGGHGLRYRLSPDYAPTKREYLNEFLRTGGKDMSEEAGNALLKTHVGDEVFNAEEERILGESYPWVKTYFERNPTRQPGNVTLRESAAVNTQFKAHHSNNGRIVGKDLDKAIDSASPGIILQDLITLRYTLSVIEDLARITGRDANTFKFYSPEMLEELINKYPELLQIVSRVKNAMKTVAGYGIPITIGGTVISNTDK